MAEKSNSTIYIGSLDERVSDKVLYDILIQAGPLVDLYIPRDKETDKPKGYAFAQYESEEVAEYAVKLFSGLVTLYKRTLKFAISGQDKSAVSLPIATTPAASSSIKPRSHHSSYNNTEISSQSSRSSESCRFSEQKINHVQVPSDISVHQSNGYRSYNKSTDYKNYSGRVFGAVLDSVSRSSSSRYETRKSMHYNSSY
ncbi:hypothetical protein ABFS82_03G124800 [Erythranthe guttata]|uniref:RRM domain-containing protein n=1 Tax=Erythranthe guttata TaxID=4155 RepID=A0A022Q500_ERYGU|nr:PREDICTED: RNA-binding protein 7 [Erythranthe guttata]EYU22704.1 hypothetical protein MIMGU_mgv1a014187mg [Erythranthe guttata]|eukprot:XP_012855043.1 PREDICTED: RNA-binding protein 7 [Erythranthe guttata]